MGLESAVNHSRRELLIGAGASLGRLLFPDTSEAKTRTTDYSKIPVPDVGYMELVKEQNLTGVKLAHPLTEIGRVQRALRWKNIAHAVGKRYGIDPHILLGMICQESIGDPIRPNDLNDGGAGLVHMQPYMARKYGLELIDGSNQMRDFSHGNKLRKAIKAENGDLKELIKYDDRWHPIKNIDAAARMICDYYQKTGSWARALEMYAGRRTYDSKVLAFAKKMKDASEMRVVEFNFNRTNKNAVNRLRFRGPITFKEYINIFNSQNANYGLKKYQKLPSHKVA